MEKIPATEAGAMTRDRLLVYLIYTYKIRSEGHNDPLILKFLTLINPVTINGNYQVITVISPG